MATPSFLPATRSAPRAYKRSIDSGEWQVENDNHRYNSKASGLMKPNPGRPQSGNGAKERPRHGNNGHRKKKEAPADSPRPVVLERRKNRDLPAGADDQIREFQALAQRLLELREQEHQDISRELHDNIAQVLSAAAARIGLAREDRMPAWLRQELLDLRAHLQSALADVRTLARDLRPSLLDHFGFAAALEKHADGFRERTRMTLEVCVDPEALSFLDDGDITHLFRLTQEALQNIEEHSGASRAWIGLSQRDGTMHLEIGDDGCSFTPERVTEAQRDGHLGLLGMHERVELLGGNFHLDAAPDRGTTIRVTVPVRTNNGGDTLDYHL
jgi:signal transduction histidine kinase